MRILHTSDWHLGEKLGRLDLSADLVGQLNRLAGYLEEHRVDVMLVAGDLFSDKCYQQDERMQAAIAALGDAFGPFLARGGTILAISGNHDVLAIFETFRGVLRLALPTMTPRAGDNTGRKGTFHLFSGPHNMDLYDQQGQCVQFQMMPYPRAAKYLKDEHTQLSSPEERHRLLQEQFIKVLQQRRDKHVKLEFPSVLLSHIPVRGLAMQNGHALTEAESVLVGQDSIDNGWTYAAFGHIHQPQMINNRPNMRYAGSLMRFDFGEAQDEKSCVLFEIGATGVIGEPQLLALPCPPIATITIADLSEIATLTERYPHAAETLAKIVLHWEPGWEVDRDTLLRQVCDIFPRWYERTIPPVVRANGSIGLANEYQIADVPTTVRGYARTHFAPNPHRSELLELLETLLTEEV